MGVFTRLTNLASLKLFELINEKYTWCWWATVNNIIQYLYLYKIITQSYSKLAVGI